MNVEFLAGLKRPVEGSRFASAVLVPFLPPCPCFGHLSSLDSFIFQVDTARSLFRSGVRRGSLLMLYLQGIWVANVGFISIYAQAKC